MRIIKLFIEFIFVWLMVLLFFYCCSNKKDVIKGTIDIVDYYYEYADSVFNTKRQR